MISDNGERAAFATISQDVARIYLARTDGTEPPNEVDTFKYSSDVKVSISPDGTKVATGIASTLRLADSISRSTKEIPLESYLSSFKIANSGQVYFTVFADNGIISISPPLHITRGLWRMNFDGSGLTRIAGPEEIASTLGTSADSISLAQESGGEGRTLGISSDSSRMVFVASDKEGPHILGVNSDGSGLREYAFPANYFWSVRDVGISGDGSKVFYIISPNPCCSTPSETCVNNFDRSDKKVLIQGPGQEQSCGNLNYDGSVLLVGCDHPAGWDNYRYLWYENQCLNYYPYRVKDYVDLRQSGSSFEDLAECKGWDDKCY